MSFSVSRGEKVAIVGESGSGKSTVISAVMQLLPKEAEAHGLIRFEGQRLNGASGRQMRSVLGNAIGYVPQDPMSNLNPVHRVGKQLIEAVRAHRRVSKREARSISIESLERSGLGEAESRFEQFPHEYSGGMRQRALIAMGSINDPALIIADEPTSALDVTVQKHILDNLDEKLAIGGRSMLLITHDLGLAADRADRVIVMHHGSIVETGPAREVFLKPQAEYTRRLIEASPKLSVSTHERPRPAVDSDSTPLMSFHNVSRTFTLRGQRGERKLLHAVQEVSFELHRGETLAVVGESGSGKSTCANLALRLDAPTSGKINFNGENTANLRGAALRNFRHRAQAVFQDPFSSLDPLKSIQWILEEPFQAARRPNRASWKKEVERLIELVRLPTAVLSRTARELSGGQRQRVAIARALALRPDLIVCDEPVSALDVLVQSQILDVLTEIQAELGVSYLFISHDLAVVQQIADTVIVMQRGRVQEAGATARVIAQPESGYTRALIEAVPGHSLRPVQTFETQPQER